MSSASINSIIFEHIGVLVCNYDVYKEKFFGLFGKQGQEYDSSYWGVDTAYDSLEKAQEAYPYKNLSDKATLKNKILLSDGSPLFILDYQGREMTDQVDKSIYDKYKTGDSVTCRIEGYGDFIRVTGIE